MISGLDFNHFSDLTERTLAKMKRHSPQAVTAVMMIVAHESNNGSLLKQLNNGPALGIIQMEFPTHQSVWENADSVHENAARLDITEGFEKLESDLVYNIFMARQYLLMIPKPLPKDLDELSVYLKRYYNTALGKAKDQDYLHAFQRWQSMPSLAA